MRHEQPLHCRSLGGTAEHVSLSPGTWGAIIEEPCAGVPILIGSGSLPRHEQVLGGFSRPTSLKAFRSALRSSALVHVQPVDTVHHLLCYGFRNCDRHHQGPARCGG